MNKTLMGPIVTKLVQQEKLEGDFRCVFLVEVKGQGNCCASYQPYVTSWGKRVFHAS